MGEEGLSGCRNKLPAGPAEAQGSKQLRKPDDLQRIDQGTVCRPGSLSTCVFLRVAMSVSTPALKWCKMATPRTGDGEPSPKLRTAGDEAATAPDFSFG